MALTLDPRGATNAPLTTGFGVILGLPTCAHRARVFQGVSRAQVWWGVLFTSPPKDILGKMRAGSYCKPQCFANGPWGFTPDSKDSPG